MKILETPYMDKINDLLEEASNLGKRLEDRKQIEWDQTTNAAYQALTELMMHEKTPRDQKALCDSLLTWLRTQ